jgi:hypothetical protein
MGRVAEILMRRRLGVMVASLAVAGAMQNAAPAWAESAFSPFPLFAFAPPAPVGAARRVPDRVSATVVQVRDNKKAGCESLLCRSYVVMGLGF